MRDKLIVLALVVVLLAVPVYGLAASAQPVTGSLGVGTYVQFGSYGGKPVIWQVIHNDTNGSVLFSVDILTYKAFDAKGDKADGRDSKYHTRVWEGSNYWPKSNIREWLNSDAAVVAYSHQKPDAQHTLDSFFGKEDLSYAQEPGFLSNFTDSERAVIQPVRHKVVLSSFDLPVKDGGSYLWHTNLDYDGAYFQWVTDKVFLLSYQELHDWVIQNGLSIGTNSYTFKDRSTHSEYWLRTPTHDYASSVYSIAYGRLNSMANAYRANGIRPALHVRPGLAVSGSGTNDNPYIIDTSTDPSGIDTPTAPTPPAAGSDDVHIYIDGQKQAFADQPVIVEGRTLLPMRDLFQALGAVVGWDGVTSTAIGSRDGIEVRIPIGSTTPTINGKPTTIQVPAQLINNRTYIPLRFVGEALGDDVKWEGETRSVIITKK